MEAEKFLYKHVTFSDGIPGGVILYRNAFSIASYEGKRDWLGFGKRSRKSPAAASHPTGSWRVRENQIAGKIEIDKKRNSVLQDLSNRQGLDENIYPHFGGTWLSDYVPNRLGGFLQEQEQRIVKPDCPLIGRDGNIYNLLGIASQTLREYGMEQQATEMFNRITQCQSYDSALRIIGDYVNITSVEQTENMDMEMQ